MNLNRKTKYLKGITLLISSSLFIGVGITGASASTSIVNGDFENGADGDVSISGWTPVNSRIDLGVDSIAGCLAVDTSDYTTLRDWDAEYASNTPAGLDPDPTVNNDSVAVLGGGDDFETTLRDGSSINSDFVRSGKVLELFSDLGASPDGYVVHGPAVYSDTFTAKTIDDLTIDWAASDDSDDYHVFGYLLNTSDCTQTEVIDSTGESSEWQTVTVAIPSNATYRFVFVSGSFDQSFGGAAGAYLYLDNITLTVNEARAAEEAARTSPPSPKIPTFDAFAAGPMTVTPGQDLVLTGSRLSCTTFVEINSQPTNFSFGTLPGGLSQLTIGMPANLTPGPHRMHMDSCGGLVTFENLLVVPKPPAVFEAVARNSIERMLIVAQVQSFAIMNRLDYNHVECIVNASAKHLQTAARQLLGNVCKMATTFVGASKGSTSELRNTHKPENIWVRVTLSHK